jgi:alpha-galactosidase
VNPEMVPSLSIPLRAYSQRAASIASLFLRLRCLVPIRASGLWRALLLLCLSGLAVAASSGQAASSSQLAKRPPMGWNDWAHYRCGFTAETILANANALVKSGLASRGYNTVTIDDCWMQKTRDSVGNLQVDPQRFPDGMKPVADAVHALGLKFGIYEDAGFKTCGGYAGSGEPDGGGGDHFLNDARLFASWGVDYLKLDGCNVYVPKGASQAAIYEKAYRAQNAALTTAGRPVTFSESAPAYFLDTPAWYDVLDWVGHFGNLWREGWDIETFKPAQPDVSRFHSVLWNYAYNLPLGRFQKPGNWDDPDFLIGGDGGMTLPETRSQMALWSMMSSPLILSSDVGRLTPEAIAVLGNPALIAIDQDPQGRMATLLRRTPTMDMLFKSLADGDYAVAVLNRGPNPLHASIAPADLGFATNQSCHFDAENLWTGENQTLIPLTSEVASHDTEIWRIHAADSCGTPARVGSITRIVSLSRHDIDSYSRCLAATGSAGNCSGAPTEAWTVSADGSIESGGRCLAIANGAPTMQACSHAAAQRWKYTLSGNLVNAADNKCLSVTGSSGNPQNLAAIACGHNQPDQIWSLPN